MSFSLRVLSVLGLAASLSALGAAQSFPEVATWTPTKTNPLSIAQMVDKKVASLRRVECETEMQFQMPQRKGLGNAISVSRIQDSKFFALRFPVISFVKKGEIHNARIGADGKQTVWAEATLKKPLKQPLSKLHVAANAKPEDWVLQHPRLLYGATIGETPFADLVRRATKPGSGFQVKINSRTMRRLNVPYPQYKLTVTRTAAAAKKLGAYKVEAIIDGKLGLPVRVASQAHLKGQEPVTVVNNVRWKVRKKDFDLNTFRLGKKTKPKKA